MKTQQEKESLKIAKANYKQALRNKDLYAFKRDQLLRVMVDSAVPNWGNIRITVTKL